MYPSLTRPQAGRLAFIVIPILAFVALWFLLATLATPFDHDEDQYIAGAYFGGRMLIFRDFLYLQPPLHAWLFAPIAWAFPSDMVLAMRIATGLTALATLAALWAALRMARISARNALIATLLMGSTAAFQFAGAVVRNDMLPTLLCTLAIMASLNALRRESIAGWALAGLGFGLAIATKLSFAPIGVAVGLFSLTERRLAAAAPLALAAGAAAGMLPMLAGWALAPDNFLYGVVTFAITAPFAWYALNGAGYELTGAEKLMDILLFLGRGPALAALVLIAINWRYWTRERGRTPSRRLTLFLLAGGLAGTAMPTPSHIQYLMPLLPGLALALGHLLDDARGWRHGPRRAAMTTLCLTAIAGLAEPSWYILRMGMSGSPILASDEAADRAGALIRRLAVQGDMATLSPHRIIDSGLPLDPRFATGPFVYRTGWTLSPAAARRMNAMTPATLRDMDRKPPGAILVGYEDGSRRLPLAPDKELIAYARSRFYSPIAMPDGIGTLYLRLRSPFLRHQLHPHIPH